MVFFLFSFTYRRGKCEMIFYLIQWERIDYFQLNFSWELLELPVALELLGNNHWNVLERG